jgi:hypothetical protein
MKKKVKISKSGLISIIALVFGFYVSLNNLFVPFENYLQQIQTDKIAMLANLSISLLILTICFLHIGRTNKPRKNQIIYIIFALVTIALYFCNFYETIIRAVAGYFVWDYSYIIGIITTIGIITEYTLLGIAEKIRGKELCTE